MVDGATKDFVQGCNAQAAVDSQAQLIVACDVTQAATDVGRLVPLLEQTIRHVGQRPVQVTAGEGTHGSGARRRRVAYAPGNMPQMTRNQCKTKSRLTID